MNRRSLLRSALSVAALTALGLGFRVKAPKAVQDVGMLGIWPIESIELIWWDESPDEILWKDVRALPMRGSLSLGPAVIVKPREWFLERWPQFGERT